MELSATDLILDTVRMKDLLRGIADRRGKIARMLASGELIHLRRGLYASRSDLAPRCLAGPIYGPSYVSFETALSWHGMIPEEVTEVLSATIKRGAGFENALGRFRYVRVPAGVYPVGIRRVTETALPFLLASPTKALCDRIARESGFRSMAEVRRWLEGMRIDPGLQLDGDELDACAEGYGSTAVGWLRRHAEKNKTVSR
jgi:hypothetical protein